MPSPDRTTIGVRFFVADALYYFKGNQTWEEFLAGYVKQLEQTHKGNLQEDIKNWKEEQAKIKQKEKKELENEQERSFEQELGL